MTAQIGAARIAYVDGLRAVAVLSVIVFHAAYHLPNQVATPFFSWQHVLFEGSHGVDLFFVLSGFCLSYPVLLKLRHSGTADFDVFGYFAKRFVRIVPPYYLALVIFAVTGLAMVPFAAADLVKQFLFLDLHVALLNASFWTLFVEFRWYFLFPIALLLWVRAPRAFLSLAFASAVAYSLTILHFVTDVATLMPFMLGIVAAHVELNGTRAMRWAGPALPAAILLGVAYEFYRANDALFFSQTNPGWQCAAFLAVIVSARPALRRMLSWRPLVLIGTASYSIYLIHEPIIVFVESHVPNSPVLATAAAAVSIAAGLVFWMLWERLWMSGRLRDRAVESARSACALGGTRLQVPARVHLRLRSSLESVSEAAARVTAAPAARAS